MGGVEFPRAAAENRSTVAEEVIPVHIVSNSGNGSRAGIDPDIRL